MLNRAEFIGHLGKDADIKTLADGTKVASFSIGISKKGYTLANGTTVPEKTTWVNIVAWKGLAEIVEKYTAKGSHVYVAGELNNRSYEKDGVTKYVTEIVADNIELLGKRPEVSEQPTPTAPQGSPTSPQGNDDLPF